MSFRGLRGDHLALIARTHAKYSIRGGTGLVFALFALIIGLIIAAAFIDPIDQARKITGDSAEAMTSMVVDDFGRPVVKFLLDVDDDDATFWLEEKPALVTAYLFLFTLLLPFVVSLGSFNQLSGDIGNRGIRYQLLRTERVNLFLGRMLGTYIFGLFVYAALFVIVFLFFVFKLDFYDTGDVAAWMLRGYFAAAVFSLAYVALCGAISCAVDAAFGSFALSQLVIGGWPLLVFIGKRSLDEVEYLSYLMPWAYKYWLFDPSLGRVFASAAIMVGFAAIFGYLGLRHFEKRDL